jgi:hypothetical protein
VTKQVESKEKETMTTIPLYSLNFSSLDLMTLQEFFLGGVLGQERTLVLDWKKMFFSP